MHRKRSRKSLETMLRKGVRSGEYVGYRLLNIEAEYIGVSWPNAEVSGGASGRAARASGTDSDNSRPLH